MLLKAAVFVLLFIILDFSLNVVNYVKANEVKDMFRTRGICNIITGKYVIDIIIQFSYELNFYVCSQYFIIMYFWPSMGIFRSKSSNNFIINQSDENSLMVSINSEINETTNNSIIKSNDDPDSRIATDEKSFY